MTYTSHIIDQLVSSGILDPDDSVEILSRGEHANHYTTDAVCVNRNCVIFVYSDIWWYYLFSIK
jgi:hypothetical protein